MTQALQTKISAHLSAAGYSDAAIAAGIAFAESEGYRSDDEALSLAMSSILLDRASLADGARVAVEPGSW